MAVILLEAAVGGAVVLWGTGVWGNVRRGFFVLTGVTLGLCAAGSWAILRGEVAAVGNPPASASALVTALAVFTILLAVWMLLLLVHQQLPATVAGIASAAAGAVSLVLFAQLRGDSGWALAELALGALFLGSTTFGLLLGHWYIVERRLTNRYMIRTASWYAAGIVAALGAAALSARNPAPSLGGGFSPLLSVEGFSVWLAIGLVAVCALIAAFVWKLAREGGRSIQAATGMFYLAVIMAFSAELSTKFRFF